MFRTLIALATATLVCLTPLAAQATDVNRASQAELESVKGIGPGLSGKILKAREVGAFKDWADLVARVGGVGAGSAAKLSQNGLTVGGAAFDAQTLPVRPAKADKRSKAPAAPKADAA